MQVSPLLCDKYMITMCYMYYETGKHEQPAVFEFFFRKHPFNGQHTIWAGVNYAIEWVNNLHFTEDDLAEISKHLPKEEKFTQWLRNIDTSCLRIRAVEEGQLVYPREPLMVLEGPLGLTQFIETTLLNLINFPTLIATNASRLDVRAQGRPILEFGARRAQGPNGALMGSLYAYIGGVQATSNVEASSKYGIPAVGTMGHSYVTCFHSLADIDCLDFNLENGNLKDRALHYREKLGYVHTHNGEFASFLAFALKFPDNFVCLVDSYSSIDSGMKNYIAIALAMIELGQKPRGVRLDSGNLVEIAAEIRETFIKVQSETGLPISDMSSIVATDGINEPKLLKYPTDHKMDKFGIGTNLITCEAQPALGAVCKLVQVNGIPIIKLSNEKGKMTLPGTKAVYRVSGKISGINNDFSLIATADEIFTEGPDSIKVFTSHFPYEETEIVISSIKRIDHSALDSGVISSQFEFNPQRSKARVDSQKALIKKLTESDDSFPTFISLDLDKKLTDLISSLTSS